MIREVCYEPHRHGITCRCGLRLLALDGGRPTLTVYVTEDGSGHCSEACAALTAIDIEEANARMEAVA